jgi:hypothetical protein
MDAETQQVSATDLMADIPVRGDQWLCDAAAALGERQSCRRCGTEVEQIESVQKSKNCWICKRCNCAYTMLIRNLSWPPPDFSSMPPEDQQQFWKACREEAGSGNRLQYSNLRALLVKALTIRKLHITKAEEKSKPQPLDAWRKQGWDADHIEKHGKRVWCPSAGWLYEVELQIKSRAVVLEEVESRITQSEQRVRETRSTGEDDRVGLESASSGDEAAKPVAKKPKVSKPGKTTADKEDAKARRKQEAEDRKFNQKMQQKATKAATYLAKPAADLKVAKGCAERNKDKLPPNIVEDIIEVAEKLIKWHDEAAGVLKGAASAASKGGRLAELEWDDKAMALLNNEAKTSLRTFNNVCKALKLS